MALTRRDFMILGVLACLAAGVALVRQPDAPALAAHDTAIRDVILQQIDAFERGDDAAAFAFAAPDIQAQFLGPEVFIAMVKAHYRPVYTAQKVAFPEPAQAIEDRPETRVQRVYITDRRGRNTHARYIMQKQPDASWKIAGCQLIETDQLDI
jgi:hypothetical protein